MVLIAERQPLLQPAGQGSKTATRSIAAGVAVFCLVGSAGLALLAFSQSAGPGASVLIPVAHAPSSFMQSLPASKDAQLKGAPQEMLDAVDDSVSPCDDFYTYACGSWDKKAVIPEDKTSWLRSWNIPADRIDDEMQKAVAEDKGVVGQYYRSCMNVEAIDKLGSKPLQPWFEKIDKIQDTKSLTTYLIELGRSNNAAFFGWDISADSEHPEKRSFYVGPAGVTLPDRSYYLTNDQEMMEHRAVERDTIERLLVLAGIDKVKARKDALNAMAFETRTAECKLPKEETRGMKGSRIMREDLKKKVPLIHWDDWFEGMGLSDVGEKGGPQLIMREDAYFDKLPSLLTNPNPNFAQLNSLVQTEKEFETAGLEYTPTPETSLDSTFDEADAEVLKSYLRYELVSDYTPYLPPDTFAEKGMKPLFSDLYGIKERPPRWKKCYHATTSAMGGHISKLYVTKFFPEANRDAAKHMLEEIRGVFKEDLKEVSWMDAETKDAATHKLNEMVFEVGYPTEWPEWCKIGELHEDTYLENYEKTQKCKWNRHMEKLREPVKRREWNYATSTDVNAYYSQKVNGLFIPAAVLDPPFFSSKYPAYRNYGSIGSVLGHEMTHGFDDEGRKFDSVGRRHEWWNKETVLAFKGKAKCIREQFGGYTLHGKPVSGKLTLGEDIADAGGLKMAYRAWLKAGPDGTRPEEEKRLFFLSFAQTWCGIERKESEESLLFDAHAPRKLRVLGALSDNKDFSHAWGCPAGSVMNRGKERCQLW